MKRYLNQEQFENLRRRLDSGEAKLTVPRRVSRQFFTRVGNASVVSTTGQSLVTKKLVIWAGVLASLFLLIACLTVVIMYFGWFAAIGAPLVGIFWTVIAGLTGDKGSWWYGLAGLCAGLLLSAYLDTDYGVPVALLTVSLFIHRATFHVAQIWLTRLVSTSYGAYDMLVEHIDLQDSQLSAEQTEAAQA